MYLELSTPAKFDATDLLSAVNDRKTECELKQLTVKKVVLRDVFTKIAVWVEKFVEVGDVVVAFDPGYAALQWAAVRFTLKVSIQDIQRHAILAEGAETISNLIVQYLIIERLYFAPFAEATALLKEAVTQVYVLVLRFLAKAKKHYQRSAPSKLCIVLNTSTLL